MRSPAPARSFATAGPVIAVLVTLAATTGATLTTATSLQHTSAQQRATQLATASADELAFLTTTHCDTNLARDICVDHQQELKKQNIAVRSHLELVGPCAFTATPLSATELLRRNLDVVLAATPNHLELRRTDQQLYPAPAFTLAVPAPARSTVVLTGKKESLSSKADETGCALFLDVPAGAYRLDAMRQLTMPPTGRPT